MDGFLLSLNLWASVKTMVIVEIFLQAFFGNLLYFIESSGIIIVPNQLNNFKARAIFIFMG